jgi:hypothetical protein
MSHFGKNEYIVRHDKVCTHLHYSICNKLGVEAAENLYSHIPETACEHEDIKLLWNQGTDARHNNKKTILIKFAY